MSTCTHEGEYVGEVCEQCGAVNHQRDFFAERIAREMDYALIKLRMGMREKFGVSVVRQVSDEINLAEIYSEVLQ